MLFSNRLSESCTRGSRLLYGAMHGKEALRYLLTSESKRSERSGHSFTILLIYSTDKHGLTVQMDRDVAKILVKALFCSLRETDYIGWYLEGRIVGAVLTVLAQDSAVEVSARIEQRLMDIFRVELSIEEISHLQVKVCGYQDLEEIES